MRELFLSMLLFVVLQAPGTGHALSYSMSPAHYGKEMEFYYANPRPEILDGLLRSFSENHILAKGENKFLLGAFFGELAAAGMSLDKFVELARSLGRDACHTLAWSAHLARVSNEKTLIARLLEPGEKYILEQIRRSPAPLSTWKGTEKSVLLMYWGAFMACGRISWVESIIDSALKYAANPGNNCAAYAAASLYEYAPRHPRVAAAVRGRLALVAGEEKKVLEKILAAVKK